MVILFYRFFQFSIAKGKETNRELKIIESGTFFYNTYKIPRFKFIFDKQIRTSPI